MESTPALSNRSKFGLRQPILLLGLLICLAGCTSSFTDISPNQSDPPTGGLTLALAGTDAALFAVSLNAGVWRRTISSGKYTWTQLEGPRYANCIAIDPASPTHIAVGEREGDAKEARLNEAGLWESFNNGQSWNYVFSPMELPSGTGFCASQVIPSLVFSSKSSLIAATTCGIARREKGSADFFPATLPPGIDTISAITTSNTKIWARTLEGLLLVSVDDGITFDFATTKPLPSGVLFLGEDKGRGDAYSLAASDDMAVMSGCCADGGPGPVSGNNANEMIIYNSKTDEWTVEAFYRADGTTITTGTYLGGRRFVRAFNTSSGTRFFFSNAQAIWEVDLKGTQTVIAAAGVDQVMPPTNPLYAGAIHVDFWDLLIDKSGSVMWLATDGGVYETRLDQSGWKPTCDGYHTLHVQSLDIILDPEQTQLAVATQDNWSWYGSPLDWKVELSLGDVNGSDADAGSSLKQAFFFRSNSTFVLVPFDGVSSVFSSRVEPTSSLSDPGQPPVRAAIQFIQSIKNETAVPLDAFMVLHRPVEDGQDPSNPIVPPVSLSGIEQDGNPWLLRNRQWKDEPDFYRALTNENWKKELDDLPEGTEQVFVAGGHINPHYFAIVRQQGVILRPDVISLVERRRFRREKKPRWVTVFTGIIDWTEHCADYEGWYGPVFVNPYDASKVFLLAPDGVKVSHRDPSGELVFTHDDVLTNLLTASGTYPNIRQFCGGNNSNVVNASRVLGSNTLAHVSFFRDDPKKTIVASPFTGVFYDNGDGKWRSFSNILPQAPVWAVRIDDSKAYIGFAGRSVGQVNQPGEAALATYFTRDQGIAPALGGANHIIARLQYSNGAPAAKDVVSVKVTGTDGKTVAWFPSITLDNQGRVAVPGRPKSGTVYHLQFTGSESEGLASCEFHFVY